MTPASAIHTLPCRDQLRASVIVLHGYSARAAVHLGDGAAFVGAGTEVVLPDAPGHGHREDGRLARIATLPGDARSEAIHDIAREWLTELPSLAAECRERGATRVGVVGISMGGFAALGTLTSPGGIDAVAALLAAPDLVDRASVVAGNPPLLLGLAGKDRSVPPGPGRRFAHECGAELHEYPESEHMMRGDDWHDLWGRTAAFLRRHLGPLPRSWCWDARWLFGCVSPPPPPPLLSDAATDRWPGVEPSLCDPLDAEAIWAAGDFVRYRVESNADGALRTWTVGLSLPEIPPRSDHALRAWDPSPVLGYVRAKSGRSEHYRDGNLMPWFVVHSERDVPIHVTLTKGDAAVPIRSIARAEALAHVSHEHVDDFPTYGLLDLTNVLLGIEPLSDALSSVIRAPSVWSVLTGGLRVQLTAHFGRPVANEPGGAAHEMVDTPLGTVPAFWLPLVLRANGQDALVCRFLVTWRRSPLLLSMAYCASKRTIRTM